MYVGLKAVGYAICCSYEGMGALFSWHLRERWLSKAERPCGAMQVLQAVNHSEKALKNLLERLGFQ